MSTSKEWDGQRLLAYVMHEGRFLTGESPEQVGTTLGLSGRTVRRLEAQQVARPRELTLEALAEYYELDPDVLRLLAHTPATGEALSTHLRAQAAAAGLSTDGRPPQLALRLARAGRLAEPDSDDDAGHLLAGIRALDPHRRELVRTLIEELQLARSEERRRGEVERRRTSPGA